MIAKGPDKMKAYVGSTGVDKMYLGNILVYGSEEGTDEMPLYVMTPSGGYVMTSLHPSTTYKIVASFFVSGKNNWGCLWGCCTTDNNNEFTLQYNGATNTARRCIGNKYYNNGTINLLDYYTVEMTSSYHSVNGTRYDGVYSGSELAGASAFVIGGKSKVSEEIWSALKVGWVRFSIYDGSTLLKDYIPWRDTDGNLCLKDNVNGELCYSGLSTKPLEYTEYTHIDRNNVMWRSGNIGTDGSITSYANQITSFIVLPRKGCSLQCVGDSTYNIGIRQYDKDFNWLNIASVAKGANVTLTLDSKCRIIRLVMWDRPSSSYVTSTADFEFDVV